MAASGSSYQLSPSRGPVGSTVTLTGPAPSAGLASTTVTLFLRSGPDAGLETAVPAQPVLGKDGTVRVRFVIPARQRWYANPMSGVRTTLPATPAPSSLEVAWPCRACAVGVFQVTAGSLPRTGASVLDAVLAAALLIGLGGVLARIPPTRNG